ncbi:MAG: ATP-binding cassette domain-containing protein [Cyanobacteria bacterium]|nr:ATP-binding cassette domain-containing protein [Cyanobacteriota bacterium]MDW8200179.1 ATP-binding cassette domain-containing protein [Cyanobacteriota bacterium SKYGB_h_bin112]
MVSSTTSAAGQVVEFRHVSYQVAARTLLRDLTFQVYRGEVLVLLGRSGSGKTTTMKLINHLLTPTSGEVWVQGKPTIAWDAIQLRRQIGYVIQETGLFPHFTIERNIGLVPTLLGWKSLQVKARVHELLHMVGLDPSQFADRYPHQLSGGQRQRVGVARALAADPPLMLMDEPFAALDPITRLDLQRQLQRLQTALGKTIVFVTHDIQEAFRLATRIGLMHNGQLIVLGTPEEFLASPEPEAQAFLDCLQTRDNGLPLA